MCPFSLLSHLCIMSLFNIYCMVLTLIIIRDKIAEKINLSQEGLHRFHVYSKRHLHHAFDPFQVYLNPTLCDYVAQYISLRHYENALFGIKGYPLFVTLLTNFTQMVQVVKSLLAKHCDIVKIYHHTQLDESMK